MNRCRDHAQALLVKARDDAGVVEAAAETARYADWIVGFHAQQAVEKAVKAVLAARNIEYPHTHNLRVLLTILADHQIELPSGADELPRLTPFSALLRYEAALATDPGALDRAWALARVHSVLAWAEGLLV